jgi:hypothetical protein
VNQSPKDIAKVKVKKEVVLENGNIVGNTKTDCSIQQDRYVNLAFEHMMKAFKKEIKDKFLNSKHPMH